MSEIYPLSMLCRFEGFPARIRVVCGRAFSEARATPFSFGSRVTLSQTPQSGVLRGTLTPGEPLPTLEVIYADTGDDDTFDLKVSHYGYGRFYLPKADSPRYALAVVKGIRVEATGIRRSFETLDRWDTFLPAGADLSRPVVTPGSLWLQDASGTGSHGATWFLGTAPAGGNILAGRLQLAGDAYLQV